MGTKSSGVSLENTVAIGVDVSKADLHIAYLGAAQCVTHECIANEPTAVQRWVQRLVGGGYGQMIIMESTARYHYLAAWRLSEAGQDVRVINPLLSSKHLKGQVRKTKTDRHDAEVLARMALSEPKLPPPQVISAKGLQIRQKMGLLQSLEKRLQSLSRTLADYQASCAQLSLSLSEAEQGLVELVKQLQHQRQALINELDRLMMSVDCPEEQLARLQTLPGYSRLVSQLVLTLLRQDVTSAKAWHAYVGMDISVRESGTRRGRGRLTKRGNAYLRKRLYCAAWGAYMHYAEVRAYYDWLKAQGRAHKEALVIIARKLLAMAFALLKNQTTYDPNIAFQIP